MANHVCLTKDRQILEIVGLAPSSNQLHRPHPNPVFRPGILNQFHHILHHLLRRHRREYLVAVRSAGLQQIKAESLGHGINLARDQLLLDRSNNLSAVAFLAANHGANAEVEAPVGVLHGLIGGLIDYLGLRGGGLKDFLHLRGDGAAHLGAARLDPLA